MLLPTTGGRAAVCQLPNMTFAGEATEPQRVTSAEQPFIPSLGTCVAPGPWEPGWMHSHFLPAGFLIATGPQHWHTYSQTEMHTVHTCRNMQVCFLTPTHNNTQTKAHHIYLTNTSTQQTARSINICSSRLCFCTPSTHPLLFHDQGLAVNLWRYCYFNHNHRPQMQQASDSTKSSAEFDQICKRRLELVEHRRQRTWLRSSSHGHIFKENAKLYLWFGCLSIQEWHNTKTGSRM